MITNVDNLKITRYELLQTDPNRPFDVVALEKTSDKPERWAVRHNNFCLNKKLKVFCIEESPSDRDDDFYKEYRFRSAKEGLDFWNAVFSEKFFLWEQNNVVWALKKQVSGECSAECSPKGNLRIGVPFEYGDGDHLNVQLWKEVRRGDIRWVITDKASTFSHLSIWVPDEILEEAIKDPKFKRFCDKNGIDYLDGEFEMETSSDTIGKDVKTFTSALMMLVNGNSKEQV